MTNRIHPSAIVHEGAELAAGVEIGPYCIVGPQARLGEGTRLLSHVSIMGRTTMGRENVVYPFCVIGGEPQDARDRGENGEVVIGDRNVFREAVTVNRGSRKGGGRTAIGSDCYLMTSSHVGHDCVVSNHVTLVNSAALGGHVEVQDYAYMSAHTAAHQYATIGRHAFVAGASRITVDAPPYMLTHGEDHEVIAVNAVGLKRHGFASDTINALKEAHRVIWSSGLPLPDAIRTLKTMFNGHYKDVEFLIDFMKASAKGRNGRARESLRNLPVPGGNGNGRDA
jgi:UDP-N-acetylglucosamine acyltransferase